jgi:peptidoglycan/xylan/chitin deacetylase (PgdA/CDA1 family)
MKPGHIIRLFIITVAVFLFFTACQTINSTAAKMNIENGTVIFTFDDGPNENDYTTARLLDVLQKHNIRAIFVLLGENAAYNPELVKRMRDEGHYLANHGYIDKWAIHLNEAEFTENLDKGTESIAAGIGEIPEPLLYRPHGGYYNSREERLWRERGYIMLPVTARSYDAVKGAADKNKVIKKTVSIIKKQGGGIILLHDMRGAHDTTKTELSKKPGGPFNRSWIPGATEEIIKQLEAEGFTLSGFDPVEALGIRH